MNDLKSNIKVLNATLFISSAVHCSTQLLWTVTLFIPTGTFGFKNIHKHYELCL